MTEHEYGALPGITASAIKAGKTSMEHMRMVMQRPRTDDGTTPAMRWGKLAHMAILEPDRFATETAVWSGGRRAGKVWDQWQEDNAGKAHITEDERFQLLAMQSVVRQDSCAANLVRHCEDFEKAIQWDGGDGIGPAKARVDGCGIGYMGATGICGGMLIEYKTCRELGKDASKFLRQAEGLGYQLQLAWYWRGLGRPEHVWCIAQESAEPYSVATIWVPAAVLEGALHEAEAIAKTYRIAEANGIFRGPAPDVVTWERPAWSVVETDISTETVNGGLDL